MQGNFGGLVAKSCLTLATLWTVAHQAPLSSSREEYWSGLPFPSPGDLLTQGLNLGLLYFRQILYQLSYQGRPTCNEIDIFVRPMESKRWRVD